MNAFVAGADERTETLAAMAALATPGESVFVVQAAPIPALPGLGEVLRRTAVQMVHEGRAPAVEPPEIEPLGPHDAEEMLALATLTEPGPFRSQTRVMGDFFGVRRDGRLAAMAGQRFQPSGHAELSGVCTHPDLRGAGLATRLSAFVTRRIIETGDTPFLHAWKDNHGAIALYRRLGYRVSRDMNVAVFQRAP